mmetsp:Transcript_6524/g.26544  ORF Transcript_6524/g.26544 Transcript_6524/m.26544 type:complete len:403 (+) Transcript_6524:81-1289(+)
MAKSRAWRCFTSSVSINVFHLNSQTQKMLTRLAAALPFFIVQVNDRRSAQPRPGRLRGVVEAIENPTFGIVGNDRAAALARESSENEKSTTSPPSNTFVRRKRFAPTIPSERRARQRGGPSEGREPRLSARVEQILKGVHVDITRPDGKQAGENSPTHQAYRELLNPPNSDPCLQSIEKNDEQASNSERSADSRQMQFRLPKRRIIACQAAQQVDLRPVIYQAHQSHVSATEPNELQRVKEPCTDEHLSGHSKRKRVGEILASTTNGRYAIVQLPGKLPVADGGVSPRSSGDLPSSTSNVGIDGVKLDVAKASAKPNMLRLSDLPEGTFGELLLYEDGSAKMQLGEVTFDLMQGTNFLHSEHIACIDILKSECSFLGQVPGRLVCTPDLSQMLTKTSRLSTS